MSTIYLHYGWNRRRLKRDKEKVQTLNRDEVLPLIESLDGTDVLYSITGSGAEKFLIAAFRKGVDIRVMDSKLVPRKADIIKVLEKAKKEDFHPFKPPNVVMLKLKHLSRAYLIIQKVRIAYSNVGLQKALDLALLEEVPLSDEYKTWSQYFDYISGVSLEAELDLKKRMRQLLKGNPVYDAVFKPIIGVGEVIASSVMGEIGDITKFRKNPAKLWTYAGLGLKEQEDHTWAIQKRKRGEASNWNEYLKLTLWKWSQNVINRQPPERSKYKRILLERKEYEAEKHDRTCEKPNCSRKGHIHRRACRYIEKRFLKDIWEAWLELEGYPVSHRRP